MVDLDLRREPPREPRRYGDETTKFLIGLITFVVCTTSAYFVFCAGNRFLMHVLLIAGMEGLFLAASYFGDFVLTLIFGVLIRELLERGAHDIISKIGRFLSALTVAVLTLFFNSLVALDIRRSIVSALYTMCFIVAPFSYNEVAHAVINSPACDFFISLFGWGAIVSLLTVYVGNLEEMYLLFSGKKTLKEQWFTFNKSTIPKKIVKLLFLIVYSVPLLQGYQILLTKIGAELSWSLPFTE